MQAVFTPVWEPVPAKAFTPQQAFLSLKSTASGRLVVVAAKAGKDGAYTASLTPEAIATQIGSEVGCHMQSYLVCLQHTIKSSPAISQDSPNDLTGAGCYL